MKKLYMIRSGNRFDQVMLFTNYNKAFQWCLKATRWDENKIKHNIITLEKKWLDAFDVFPHDLGDR